MNGVIERFSSSPFDQKLTENCSVVIFETPNEVFTNLTEAEDRS